MEKELIAPCGMNCGICSSFLAYANDLKSKGIQKTSCTGCRPEDKKCALKKRCKLLLNEKVKYCFECKDFPCKNLERLDKRYSEHYRMSMIENLEFIKKKGIKKFLAWQEKKWKCPDCGGTICCHNGICYECGLEKLKNKKRGYRWDNE